MTNASNMKTIGNEGGYDLDELKQAKEQFEEKHGSGVNTAEFEDVEPIYIQVTSETAVEQREYESRSVIIEYDQNGEVVSVELL